MKTIKKIKTAMLGTGLSAALGLGLTAAYAEQAEQFLTEQFFLFDGDTEPVVASTADGKFTFEIIGEYAVMQGDMVLGDAKTLIKQNDTLTQRGIARTSLWDRWLDGIVYYQFDENLGTAEVDKVQQALDHWNDRSSLTFVERTAENESTIEDYINFEPADGCASYVGRNGESQALWVAPQCPVGSLIHEIGHAVGLFHEHTRSDRDNYITVVWGNITQGRTFNFDIMEAGVEPIGEYDYDSIMHYGTSYFSNSGDATIIAPDNVNIGQRQALSDGDLAAINAMYTTDLVLSTQTPSSTDLDLTVTNSGLQGAHAIRISLPVDDPSKAAGYLGNGWECSTQNSAIICELERLKETESSTVSIRLNDHDIEAVAAGAALSSKTHDSDLSNNGAVESTTDNGTDDNQTDSEDNGSDSQGNEENDNETDSDGQTGTDSETDNGNEQTDGDSNDEEPKTTDGEESNSPPTNEPDLGAGQPTSSGGGGAIWWLLFIALTGVLRRLKTIHRHI